MNHTPTLRPLNWLPDELIKLILDYLTDDMDVLNTALTCKRCERIVGFRRLQCHLVLDTTSVIKETVQIWRLLSEYPELASRVHVLDLTSYGTRKVPRYITNKLMEWKGPEPSGEGILEFVARAICNMSNLQKIILSPRSRGFSRSEFIPNPGGETVRAVHLEDFHLSGFVNVKAFPCLTTFVARFPHPDSTVGGLPNSVFYQTLSLLGTNCRLLQSLTIAYYPSHHHTFDFATAFGSATWPHLSRLCLVSLKHLKSGGTNCPGGDDCTGDFPEMFDFLQRHPLVEFLDVSEHHIRLPVLPKLSTLSVTHRSWWKCISEPDILDNLVHLSCLRFSHKDMTHLTDIPQLHSLHLVATDDPRKRFKAMERIPIVPQLIRLAFVSPINSTKVVLPLRDVGFLYNLVRIKFPNVTHLSFSDVVRVPLSTLKSLLDKVPPAVRFLQITIGSFSRPKWYKVVRGEGKKVTLVPIGEYWERQPEFDVHQWGSLHL